MVSPDRLDDPRWMYILNTKLAPYIPDVREFWKGVKALDIKATGVFPVRHSAEAPGLMYRMTNTAARSPVKGVQVFPFVPVTYLQIMGVAGGVNRMVSRVCAGGRFKIDEFTIIEKSNLPSTYHHGQFIAFIPTAVLSGAEDLGKWMYITAAEIVSMQHGVIPASVRLKLGKYKIVN